MRLTFEGGTVVLEGGDESLQASLPVTFDPRTRSQRAEARHYRAIVEHLRAQKITYEDTARNYGVHEWTLLSERKPFPHQEEAVATWWRAGARGVVVLPTGTGKRSPPSSPSAKRLDRR